LAQDELVQAFESELERLWSRPSKNEASRGKVKSGSSLPIFLPSRDGKTNLN
jgi:hypothetical protein